ncbi:MAG: XdhC family protein [Calditrichaceae bacterium]|nr:XdhC family protein [Calditrichia bacterium]NUQ40555.1 XdhC family protein [Calditrichaceae bacterium]
MQEIYTEAVKLISQNQPFALATVVRCKGSTPQKPGAKMLIRADGSAIGTLGGGCVEGDIWAIATEMLRKKEPPQFRSYTLNEELAAEDGLVCGGTMYFWIEPVYPGDAVLPFMLPILEAIAGGKPLALATVVKAGSGGDPPAGSKLLVYEDGETFASPENREIEAEVLKAGRRLAALGENEYLQTSGAAEIFVEGFTTPPTLIIMGGGHVGKAVSSLAATLGYRIIIIDDREDFANPERFPEAFRTIAADYEEGLGQVSVNLNTFIVIATRGHRHDDVALQAALRTPARYLGLLGSKRKSLLIYKNLYEKGIPLSRIREIHAPVGLNIGALTPEEIAVSIMGEIIAVRRGGEGGFMKLDSNALQNLLS